MATALPQLQRQESIQPMSVPDYGSAFQQYASATNSLSEIGARVAQSASTQLATDMGYNLGQKPQGDLLPPITDFDKTMVNAYQTQAQATISLQADKMMTDAQVEMSKAPRLTPDLIAKTNQQMMTGLDKILKQAPTAIKPQLTANFQSQLINQNANYQQKMISQQKEDQRNILLAAMAANATTAYNQSASGNYEAGESLVKQTEAMGKSGVASNLITPLQAQTAKDTVQTAHLNAKYINQAITARNEGKLPEFYKNFATNKPADLTYEQWQTTGSAMSNYVGMLDNLRRQDENLRLAQFNTAVAQDPNGITGQMIADLKENTTPIEFEQAHLTYINAMKSSARQQQQVDSLIDGFTDASHFGRFTPTEKNQAFDTLVSGYTKKMETQGVNITPAEAEAQVATSAAGPIPGYISTLNAKLASTNPADIESAGVAVEHIMQAGKGANLVGLNTEAKAMYQKYNALRTSMPQQEAANAAYEVVYGKDQATFEANNEKWSNYVKNSKSTGESPAQFALRQAGLSGSFMRNSEMYGLSMLNTYESYYKLLNGDENSAKKMFQQTVKQLYGETSINGEREMTYLPIERTIGLPEDAKPFVLDDVYDQLQAQMKSSKELYDEGKTDWYWDVVPRVKADKVAALNNRIKSGDITQDQIDSFAMPSKTNKVLTADEIINTVTQKNDSIDLLLSNIGKDNGGKKLSTIAAEGLPKIGKINATNIFGLNKPSLNEQLKLRQQLQAYRDAPLQIVRRYRSGAPTEIYDVALQADPWLSVTGDPNKPLAGGWDISIKTAGGLRSIYRTDPSAGIISYRPDIKKIRANYATHNPIQVGG